MEIHTVHLVCQKIASSSKKVVQVVENVVGANVADLVE